MFNKQSQDLKFRSYPLPQNLLLLHPKFFDLSPPLAQETFCIISPMGANVGPTVFDSGTIFCSIESASSHSIFRQISARTQGIDTFSRSELFGRSKIATSQSERRKMSFGSASSAQKGKNWGCSEKTAVCDENESWKMNGLMSFYVFDRSKFFMFGSIFWWFWVDRNAKVQDSRRLLCIFLLTATFSSVIHLLYFAPPEISKSRTKSCNLFCWVL